MRGGARVAGRLRSSPSQAEIDRAVEAVKKDPNLAAEKSVRTLDLEELGRPRRGRQAHRSPRWPSWLSWIPNLFGGSAQFSQMLVWVLIAGLVGLAR